MLRGFPESLLSRSLTQRAPLARVLPLLLAFAPEAFRFRSLHVFAKTTASHDEFSKVTVGDSADAGYLKRTVIAELKLDAAPNRVRLLREVEGGGAPVPLDSRRALAEQGVLEGASVLVEVMAPLEAPAPSAAEAAALEGGRRLLAALRAAELEPIPASRSSLIRLPEGALWPQLGAAPLFVRSFYQDCYEGPLASCDPGGLGRQRKFIVRGNAGIGKSAFGAYVLWRAVKAGRTVVYTSDKVDDSFVFHSSGQVEVFGAEDFARRTRGVLKQASTVFICDGVKPPVKSAFTLLITSPTRERYKEFFKLEDCRMLTFPVFFLREVKDLASTCFPHLSSQGPLVEALFAKWGGIVRYVLAKHDEDSQLELEDALTSINLEELYFHLGARAIESEDSASHRLLHLQPVGAVQGGNEFSRPRDSASYALAHTDVASPYVRKRVFEAMQQRHYEHLNLLLAQPIVSPSYSRLYGSLFEEGAIAKLLKGGIFEAFDCTTGTRVAGGVRVLLAKSAPFPAQVIWQACTSPARGWPPFTSPAAPPTQLLTQCCPVWLW